MRVKVCGARGSLPSPGEDKAFYGGNTSCVQIRLSDGSHVVLDAGTGIRNVDVRDEQEHIHLLLTHLHLDHIQGLLFFTPLFHPDAEVTIWGPAAGGVPLRDRIARYLSAPLTPVEVRELPCQLDFRNCPVSEWRIGPARLRAEAVTHRGPTLGFRIEDAGMSLCYLPDHEPALVGPIDGLEDEWLSGYALARGADVLLHDAQYTDEEYPGHFGWGHSAISQVADFAARCQVGRTMLFHHDPYHTDADLETMLGEARERWAERGRDPAGLELAREGAIIELGSPDAADLRPA
jgi:phosphoribosyl 1,2-cyclic phosphodiesterase